MMLFEMPLLQSLMKPLGWALVHFIWQGALIALIVASLLNILRASSAQARYAVATISMMLMLVAPIITVSHFSLTSSGAGDDLTPKQLSADARRVQSAVSFEGNRQQLLTDSEAQRKTSTELSALEAAAEDRFAPVLRWVVLFWGFGILLLSLRFFSGWIMAERLKRRGLSEVTGACLSSFTRLAEIIGVSRAVRIYRSVLVEVPTVIGWLRPVILVPTSVLAGLTPQQLEALLAHELAHIRRYDYLVNLMQAIVETLLFYHPAVWWVSRQIRMEREHACDDLAVAACGNKILYARALTELEEMRARDTTGLTLAANGGSLVGRIRRLLIVPSAQAGRASTWLALVLLIITTCAALAFTQTALLSQTGKSARVASGLASRREVAVTFVSLPYFRINNETVEALDETTDKMLKGLAAHHITAVGFVGEGMLYREGQTEARINILRKWLDRGHELGNQGYMHKSLYKTPLAEYEENVIRGEQVTRSLMQERGKRLRYYSYPFLNTGPNLETKRAFEGFLKERGYTIHPVTIDNMEWIFSNAYAEARKHNDTETMRRIVEEYIPYMERVFEHYERLSVKAAGREIPQVLMLTASRLNADHLDKLAEMLKRRGYHFVSLEQALQDPIYSQAENYAGAWGISWLERWGLDKGTDIRGDPVLPPYMKQFDKDGLKVPDKKSD
jgi:beta-lactamase regulating signal transducer with metallopeptidase domain/peptidoglycan/xylan/chitin deacetylase (PgdA/CDA1 family)